MTPEERDAATDAFDAIAKLCGCPEWYYPGQIVRDVEKLKAERDELRSALEECVEAFDPAAESEANDYYDRTKSSTRMVHVINARGKALDRARKVLK